VLKDNESFKNASKKKMIEEAIIVISRKIKIISYELNSGSVLMDYFPSLKLNKEFDKLVEDLNISDTSSYSFFSDENKNKFKELMYAIDQLDVETFVDKI
jgi:hypothetical protein